MFFIGRNHKVTLCISDRNYKHWQNIKKHPDETFNLSKFLDDSLDIIWWGNGITDAQVELETLKAKRDKKDHERDVLNARIGELEKTIEGLGEKQVQEKRLFDKFHNHVRNRIKNIDDMEVAPNYDQLRSLWQQDFFPNNNISVSDVKQVFHCCRNESLNFEYFQKLRWGDNGGD